MEKVAGKFDSYSVAHTELVESELRLTYGLLVERAVSSFEADPMYLIEMAESAAAIEVRRKLGAEAQLARVRQKAV